MHDKIDITARQDLKTEIYCLFGARRVQRLRHLDQLRHPADVPQADVYVLDSPNYWNLGDLAIAHAEARFLTRMGLHVHELFLEHFWNYAASLRRQKDHALFTFNGGGNIGDLYPNIEFSRCAEIDYLRPDTSLLFPQSFRYSDRPIAQKQERYVRRMFEKSGITLCARDAYSYERMKAAFPANASLLLPDMVLGLGDDPLFRQRERDPRRVVFCLRHDIEKADAQGTADTIARSLRDRRYHIRFTDTSIPGKEVTSVADRDKGIEDFAGILASASLVVTDRLHGMVLSSLCGTPCLALPNNGRKIKDLYSTWLSGLDYVSFVEDPQKIDCADEALRLLRQGPGRFPTARFDRAFEPLVALIRNMMSQIRG